MELTNFSRAELKKMCLARGVENAHQLSKPEMIKALNALSPTEIEEKVIEELTIPEEIIESIETKPISSIEELPKPIKKLVLSDQAKSWKEYLGKINTTPTAFLATYPNHRYKIFVEEIIAYQNQLNAETH